MVQIPIYITMNYTILRYFNFLPLWDLSPITEEPPLLPLHSYCISA